MLNSRELERIRRRLRAFVRRRVRDAHLADDVVQDVLLRAQQSPSAPSEARALSAWLFRAARNAIIDFYRSPVARRWVEMDDVVEPTVEPVDSSHDFAACVSKMVRCLPEPYRSALWLADHEGLTQADLAARVGVSLSGVKSRVQRAREKMRQLIDDCCEVEFDSRGGVADYDGCGKNRYRSEFCASNSCADSSTEVPAAMGVAG